MPSDHSPASDCDCSVDVSEQTALVRIPDGIKLRLHDL